MFYLASGRRRLGLDEEGRLVWLSGADGKNRIRSLLGPVIRLLVLEGGRREVLTPEGRPDVRASERRLDLRWTHFRTPYGTRVPVTVEAAIVAGNPSDKEIAPGVPGGGFAWHLRLETDAVRVIEAVYPMVGGLRGEALLYPHHAGERITEPARELTSERYLNFHRGKTVRESDGTYSREMPYCGLASMAWMELDSSDGGTYLGSHDPAFGLTGLLVQTDGDWLALAIRRYCSFSAGVWEAPMALLVPHEGDWHIGARVYRSWAEKLLPRPQRPAIMAGRPGVNPRYDFKNGGRVWHRFAEIPEMHEAGVQSGIDHFFIAGWNRGGFDTNYPEYYPDMELGSAEELARGCRYIRDRGDPVTFYINARLFDTGSDYYPTLGAAWAIKDEAGNRHFEVYEPNRFAVMCPGHEPWRRHIVDSARWLQRATGCQGIYLDQLGSAEPFPCYDPAHGHEHPGAFNQGYIEVLEELRSEAILMIENCGDIYSSRIWGSLAWNGEFYDEFFNLYRYTFPEHNLVNMVHPRHIDDPALRERLFYRDLERAWLLGSYYWAAPQRRFKPGNERLLDHLTRALRLRRAAEPWFARARYVDDEGVVVEGGPGLRATRFQGDGFSLIAVVNPELEAGEITLPERPGQATCLGLGREGEVEWAASGSHLPLPQSALALLILR
ncbi:MAG: DUF6259 domain-containing protein [Actinobacteria bacterium]|nr:DUF6259 domain-containing protein [Actinomycetota bacterium]